MPKGSKQIKNFAGGLNTYADPRDIKDNEFQALDNVSTDENARIRLSGGFEKKEISGQEIEEISFGRPSPQVASVYSDFKPVSIPGGDFSLTPKNEAPTDWVLDKGLASNVGWLVGSSLGDGSGSPVINTNTVTISADSVIDMGSITSSNFKLVPGENYKVGFSIICDNPFMYIPEAELPRIRIINDTLAKYISGNAITSDIDEFRNTAPQMIPKATSNLCIAADDGEDDTNIGWSSYADWNAGANMTIARETDSSDSLKGYMGTGTNYVLTCNTNTSYNQSTNIYTDAINISSYFSDTATDYKMHTEKKQLFFDCLYNTEENQGQWKIQVYDNTNGSVIMEKILEASNGIYTNINMGVNGWEYSSPEMNNLRGVPVNVPNTCTSIILKIIKTSNGVGTIKMTGFRLYPANPVSLGGSPSEARVGSFNGGFTTSWKYNVGFPNTWSQNTNPPYVTSSFSDYKTSSLSNKRKYYFDFTIPEEYDNSSDWKISINAGKWGASQAISQLTISIYDINIIRVSGKANVNDSHYILVPQYKFNKTKVVGYQYNTDSKMYEKFPDSYNEMLPIFNGKAYVNFTTIFGRTIISNGDFSQDSQFYTFFYDNLSKNQGYKVISGEQFVPSLHSMQTVAGSAMEDGYMNVLGEYVNRAGSGYNHSEKNDNVIRFGSNDYYEGGYVINTRSNLQQKWCNSLAAGTRDQSGDADHNVWYTDSDSSADDGAYWHAGDAHREAGDGFNIHETLGFSNSAKWIYGTAIRFPHPNDQNMTNNVDYPAWAEYSAGNISNADPIHKLMEWTSGILDGTTDTGGSSTLEGPIKRVRIGLSHEMFLGGLATGAFEPNWHPGVAPAFNNPWTPYQEASGIFSGSVTSTNLTNNMTIQLWSMSNDIGGEWNPSEMLREYRLEMKWDMGNRGDNENNNYGVPDWTLVYSGHDTNEYNWGGTGQGSEISNIEYFDFDLSHGEMPLTGNYALKFIPDQYGDAWGACGGRVHSHIYETTGDSSEGTGSHTVRGIREHSKWNIDFLTFYSYDSNYNTGAILNLTDEQVGLQVEMGANEATSGDEWVGTWYVKLTTVNYFDEESPLGEDYQEWSNSTVGHAPTMIFQLGTAIDFDSHLIKEVKIYMKKSSSDNSGYRLQLKVDLLENKMYAVGNGETVSGSVHSTDTGHEVLAYVMPRENLSTYNSVDSYMLETGLMESEAKNQAMMSAQWKTSTIVNNRMYIGNIMQEGKIYTDRMIKSEQNKFGIFPRKNWIDVVINDGDEIVSLQSYMDKLLQFKHRKLFIINVANEQEGEYLEQTIEGIGIQDESQITKTIHGICWINERGLFLYDGNSINNLIEDKLAVSKWKDTISGWDIKGEYYPIIGYDRKSDKLIILPTGYSSQDIYDDNNNELNTGDVYSSDNSYRETWRANVAYVYDFQRKSFTMSYAGQRGLPNEIPYYIKASEENSSKPFYKVPPITGKRSNFYYDINGDLSILTDGSISPGKFVYNDIPSATPGLQDFYNDRNMRIITKDYDFGDPAVRKKVHKVYVTFKSTNEETTLVENANLTKDFYASSFVKVYHAIDGSNNWKEFDSNKSKNYDSTRGLVDEKSENTTTLTNAIVSTDTTITVGSTSNILQDYVIKIDDEHMLVESVPSSTTLVVKRGYGYTSDDTNSYTLLVGINHDAASTIAISNGDWIQAELVPKESLNNIKSLKLMFVQAQVETTSTTIYSDEMIDIVDGPPIWSLQNTMQSITGQYTVNSPTNFSWAGTGEYELDNYQYNFLYSVFTNDDEIFPGEKVIFEITVSNFTTNGVGDNNYIEFLTNGTGSGFTKMTFTGNDTQTQEWTRPEYEDWQASTSGVEGNGSLFYHFRFQSYTNVTAADIEINVKKDLGLQFSQTGNVPKGFQINDISIINRTKNVR